MTEAPQKLGLPKLLRKPALTWVVCSPSDRWCTAVKRFAPEILDQTAMVLVHLSVSDAESQFGTIDSGIILWDFSQNDLVAANLHALTLIDAPKYLHIACVDKRDHREKLLLGEFGLSMQIQQPEELPGLGLLIRRYTSQTLDNS